MIATEIDGSVARVIPPKRNGRGDPISGGYIWINGSDGVAYFGHITEIQDVDIYDIRIHDPCRFVPEQTSKGPAAKRIRFLELT